MSCAPPIKTFRIVLRENVVKNFSQLILVLLKEPRCQETTIVISKPIYTQTCTNTDTHMQNKILILVDDILEKKPQLQHHFAIGLVSQQE